MSYFSNCLKDIRKNVMVSEIHDLGNLMIEIQKDSRLGFSTLSFIRRAKSQREIFIKDSCCVRAASVPLRVIGPAIYCGIRPAQRSFPMTSSSLSCSGSRGISASTFSNHDAQISMYIILVLPRIFVPY